MNPEPFDRVAVLGLGLLGATVIVMIFQNTASAILIGFGFGGSLLALFLRVGGGIFTQAADVGADLAGKVFVHKQPLNVIDVGLINALFPDARNGRSIQRWLETQTRP